MGKIEKYLNINPAINMKKATHEALKIWDKDEGAKVIFNRKQRKKLGVPQFVDKTVTTLTLALVLWQR